jgi:hypothetical protein
MSSLLWWYMFHFEPCMFVAFDQGTCGDCGLVSWIRGNFVRGDACLFWHLWWLGMGSPGTCPWRLGRGWAIVDAELLSPWSLQL